MIICIGAFDGYHRGHLSLFEKAREMSRARNTDWRIMTFHPHPRSVLGKTHSLLFTGEEKALLRTLLDMPEPIRIPFTLEFAGTEPAEFLAQVRSRMEIEGIVVGENFRFGKDRSGDGEFLKKYCSEAGIELALMPRKITSDGKTISSTRLREMVRSGDVADVPPLLSYPYFIQSEVVHGSERGRSIGYPTANIVTSLKKLIPCESVYAGAAVIDGQTYAAAISVGRNPTFGELDSARIEAHILDYSGNLYEKRPVVVFLEKLRPMEKFSGPESLAAQLKADCARTRKIYAVKEGLLDTFRM